MARWSHVSERLSSAPAVLALCAPWGIMRQPDGLRVTAYSEVHAQESSAQQPWRPLTPAVGDIKKTCEGLSGKKVCIEVTFFLVLSGGLIMQQVCLKLAKKPRTKRKNILQEAETEHWWLRGAKWLGKNECSRLGWKKEIHWFSPPFRKTRIGRLSTCSFLDLRNHFNQHDVN